MYKNYSFNLEWNEIDEEIRNQKIDEYITYLYENNDLDNEEMTLDQYLEDPDTRNDAENSIECHFPIYF